MTIHLKIMVSYLSLLVVYLNPFTSIASTVEKTLETAAHLIDTLRALQMTLLMAIRKQSFPQETSCLPINMDTKITKMSFYQGHLLT